MKLAHILTAGAISILALRLFYLNRAGQAPASQPPIRNLTPENITQLPRLFNASMQDARVVMLLSPT